LNPRCTTYVGDASPSVVAVRISECFRKRSIAVEYDDEAVRTIVLYCIVLYCIVFLVLVPILIPLLYYSTSTD
jgi:hypothetical protein